MTAKNCLSKATYFLVGMGFGTVGALLLAPKSGKETRRYIGEKAEESTEYLAAKGRQLRRQVGDVLESGETAVAKGKERLADAFETGRRVYRENVAV